MPARLQQKLWQEQVFDWLMIDMEHGSGDILCLISQLQAMKGYGVDSFVRALWNDFVQIKKILDTGVNGFSSLC